MSEGETKVVVHIIPQVVAQATGVEGAGALVIAAARVAVGIGLVIAEGVSGIAEGGVDERRPAPHAQVPDVRPAASVAIAVPGADGVHVEDDAHLAVRRQVLQRETHRAAAEPPEELFATGGGATRGAGPFRSRTGLEVVAIDDPLRCR